MPSDHSLHWRLGDAVPMAQLVSLGMAGESEPAKEAKVIPR